MIPTDSISRALSQPQPAKAATVATPPASVANTAKPLANATPSATPPAAFHSDGMMSDRLSRAKANAYLLGGGAPPMSWVDPPGSGPTWPRGPLSPDGGKTVQPGVDQVQDKLVSLGYADPSIATGDNRGRYGTQTEAAVRELQMASGIRPVTGVADQATLAAMNSASAVSKSQALQATPEQSVISPSIGTAGPAPVPTAATLQLPPRTGTINSTQNVNVRSDSGTGNAVVGQFKPGTEVTIVDPQPPGDHGGWLKVSGTGANGQPVEGWVGPNLVQEPPRQDPRVASRMEDLGYVQQGGQVNDVAIKNFQAVNGLPETGTLDDATLAAMWSADAKVNTHVMQYTDPVWNPTGPGKSNNCGPASVAMALAAAGIITIDPSNPEAAIDAARALTGGTKSDTTGSGQLTTAVTGQGGQAYPITNLDEVQLAVSSGDPVVLFGYEQKNTDYRGAHWVAVVGYDQATDTFLVSDPLAADGVQHWSRADMEAYANFSVDQSVAVHNPNG